MRAPSFVQSCVRCHVRGHAAVSVLLCVLLFSTPCGHSCAASAGEQGVGPMRLWPGGLCVSRSVGDLDAGAEVMPVPHIRQVNGCS